MKIIYQLKNNYFFVKLTILLLFVYGISFSQADSCAFFGNRPIFPYYHPNPPSNGKDFYTTKKEFQNVITAQTNFNGIITINFYINYKGEADYYRTQICDLNYLPLSISKDIELLSSQILFAVKLTSPWIPASNELHQPINSRKFYSFRFTNGKLIEILPK